MKQILKEWGIHENSEEAFVLLCGCCFLAICNDLEQFTVIKMEPFHLYIVGKGEKHAIILNQSTSVFIMENDDMSHFQSIPIDPNILRSIQRTIEL